MQILHRPVCLKTLEENLARGGYVGLVDATLAGEGGVLGSCLGPHLSLLPPIFLAPAPAHIQVLIEQALPGRLPCV